VATVGEDPPPAGVEIRPARPGEAPLVLALIRELAEYERLAHEVKATAEDVAAALFGERPDAESLLAFLDGEPVGFALFFHNYSTFVGRPGLYLEDLFVRPAARGLGIGQALLRRLAGVALERDCGRMEWAVLDWNEPAIGFYHSLGAQAMDAWTVYRLEGPNLAALAAGAAPAQDS
jgi:GNAT superfamily N-acetyltransferase